MEQVQPWLMTDEQLAEARREFIDGYFDIDGEIFQRPHGAGYWLYGVEYDDKLGWLAFEFDEQTFDSRDEKQHAAAKDAWRKHMALPPNYFRLDDEVAGKVFDNLLRKWGQKGLDDVDVPRVDYVLQWTILGEERYG